MLRDKEFLVDEKHAMNHSTQNDSYVALFKSVIYVVRVNKKQYKLKLLW